MADINFPTDTVELINVATNDLIPIYDVSIPWDLQDAQAINIAKTLLDDASTTATDRTWSVNKSKTYIDWRDSTTSTLANKTINADNNTITNLEVDNLKTGVLDTDLTSVSASDDTIPSAKATKAMWDLKIPLTYVDTDWTLTANSDTKLASQKATKTYVDNNIAPYWNINWTNLVYSDFSAHSWTITIPLWFSTVRTVFLSWYMYIYSYNSPTYSTKARYFSGYFQLWTSGIDFSPITLYSNDWNFDPSSASAKILSTFNIDSSASKVTTSIVTSLLSSSQWIISAVYKSWSDLKIDYSLPATTWVGIYIWVITIIK